MILAQAPFASAFLTLVGAQSHPTVVGIVNTDCFSPSAAFCLEHVGLNQEESRLSDGRYELRIRPFESDTQGAIIRYPPSCLRRRANTAHMHGYSHSYRENGRTYIRTDIRLRTTRDCDLEVLAPAVGGEVRSLLGLSLVMTVVQICRSNVCDQALITAVPRRLRRFWFGNLGG